MGTPKDTTAGPPSARPRLEAVDWLRGIVMVLMALDHVRDYFSNSLVDPVALSQTTPALFLTRWITHYCAPTFVFLAGASAFLFGCRGRSRQAVAWFLLSRGLWLVLIETTVVRASWNFNFNYAEEFGGGVIWVIGWSLVVLSGLVYLPTSAIAVLGIALVSLHNLLDGKTAADVHLPEGLWVILHEPKQFLLTEGGTVAGFSIPALHFVTGYSLLPWLGVICCGYAFGSLLLLDSPSRRRQLLGLGLTLTALFIALRATNAYGDRASERPDLPGPWHWQDSNLFTVFSFVNCQKYPPSLLFLLMTLGPAITLLALLDRPPGRVCRFFIVYGRVPFFYYLLHLPLIHGLMVGMDYLRFGESPFAHRAPWTIDRTHAPPDYGYGLPIVYLVWLGVVLLLYWPCRWFGELKRRHRSAWLSYF